MQASPILTINSLILLLNKNNYIYKLDETEKRISHTVYNVRVY